MSRFRPGAAALGMVAALLTGGCSASGEAGGEFPQVEVPGHCDDWPDFEAVDSQKVSVRVLNHGAGSGAAATAARDLEARGFNVLTTGNDPEEEELSSPAVIRYGEMGLSAARTLSQEIDGARLERIDRQDPSVDVILGEDFEQLAQQPAPEPEAVTVNVYNISAEPVAQGVADTLESRGFTVPEVSNDPEESWYPEQSVVIRYGLASEPEARTVAAQVQNPILVEDGRTEDTVDLVISPQWEGMTDELAVPEEVPEVALGDRVGCD